MLPKNEYGQYNVPKFIFNSEEFVDWEVFCKIICIPSSTAHRMVLKLNGVERILYHGRYYYKLSWVFNFWKIVDEQSKKLNGNF
jgi:hypothetical protein